MAAPLDDILNDGRVVAARDLRDAHAARARETRARHVFHARCFAVATMVAAVAGTFILYGAGGSKPDDAAPLNGRLLGSLSDRSLRTPLFGVQVLALAVAAYAAQALGAIAGSGDWLRERRAAELGRIGLFEQIMAVAAQRGPAAEAAAFDHFLAEQLQGQITHYRNAESRHRRALNRTAVVGSVIAAVAAGAAAIARASGVGGEAWIAVAAGILVVAPVLANAVRSYQEATLDREKAERYRDAWAALMRIKADAADAGRALASGDPAGARQLVTRVHAVMRSENSAWEPAKPPE